MSDTVTAVLLIYLIIGVGNFASHMINCGMCRQMIGQIVEFFLHGVMQICSWPKTLFFYLEEIYQGERKREGMFFVSRQPGETMDHFMERAKLIAAGRKKDES